MQPDSTRQSSLSSYTITPGTSALITERLEITNWPHLKRPVLCVTVGNVSRIIARFESEEAKDEFLSFQLKGAERTRWIGAPE